MKMFLVVLEKFDAEGVDVHGLFSTKAKAENYVETFLGKTYLNPQMDSFEILETSVDGEG